MSITSQSEIKKVKQILCNRKAKLFHACQLQDFRSYVKLGGIPSRNKLSNSNLPFTTFDTDNIDKDHDLWNKVFGNFSDFGIGYSKALSKSFPNPYGPIQIVLNPSAFDEVSDIAISLRSAGAGDFDRGQESLKSSQDLNQIYFNIEIKKDTTDKYTAFSKTLNERFNRSNCTSPEFNCTIENEIISFEHCVYIIVDNCIFNGKPLIDEVKKITPKTVCARTYDGNKGGLILELSKLTHFHDCSKKALLSNVNASDELKNVISGMNEFHFNRFISYLTSGTTRAQ